MFKPKYSITHKLLANIKRITEIVSDLNSRSFSNIVLVELENKAREVSAFSSTSIEGNPLPLTDVKRILKNKPEYIRDSEKEILNYNKAIIELNDLIKAKKVIFNLALILKIQKNITSDLIQKNNCGQLRQEPVFVNNPKTGQTVYWPPEQKEVNKLLQDLISYSNDSQNKVDPLILAGIFHKQFVVIHPFIDGNGRTARLATKVLLAKMGLNTFNLFSFENYYNQNVSRYFKEVGLQGNYYDIKNELDFTAWLEYFTDGIIDELLRVRKDMDISSSSPQTELKSHHQKILKYIKDNGFITDKDYAQLTKRAKPTRNLDFRKLIALDLIVKYGQGRATHYKFK
jgi:Fic family protein